MGKKFGAPEARQQFPIHRRRHPSLEEGHALRCHLRNGLYSFVNQICNRKEAINCMW
jgi:hypothetical protein